MLFTAARFCFWCSLLGVSALALLPQEQIVVSTGWDKSDHLLAFFVLLMTLDIGFRKLKLWQHKVWPLAAYAVFIEVAQYFIPGRYFSLLDLVGGAAGLGLFLLLRPAIIRLIEKWSSSELNVEGG